MSFEDLGNSVARTWGLPDLLVAAMRKPPDDSPVRPPERRGDWFRLLGGLGNELTEMQLRTDRKERAARNHGVIERYAKALGMTSNQIWEAVDAQPPPKPEPDPGKNVAAGAGSSTPPAPADLLAHTVSQLRAALALPYDLNALLLAAGESVYTALQCQHVVIALREFDSDHFSVRHAWGPHEAALRQHFRFSLRDERDVFSALCTKGADTLIRDATAPTFESRLPPWFRRHVGAATFMLLPLMSGGQPAGLLYADRAQANSFNVQERELTMLRALRDELQRAIAPSLRKAA